jgi:undecaprenyl-diphosphatase
MDFLIQLDQSLFLWLNSLHASWVDPVMWWLSDKLIWIPLYLFILYLIIKKYEWKTVGILMSIALLIAATDQVSVFIKYGVERFRPTHTESLKESIHTLNNYYGGAFGFVSSHAANSFALATITSFFLAPHYRHYRWMAFLWAALVSYSRIYLGVHFPGDILGGAILGIVLAIFFYQLYLAFSKRCSNDYC